VAKWRVRPALQLRSSLRSRFPLLLRKMQGKTPLSAVFGARISSGKKLK
jgi:hypothetical protein